MKLTKTKLKQIIKEEIKKLLKENFGSEDVETALRAPGIGSDPTCLEIADRIKDHIQDVETRGTRPQADGLSMAVGRMIDAHPECPDLGNIIYGVKPPSAAAQRHAQRVKLAHSEPDYGGSLT